MNAMHRIARRLPKMRQQHTYHHTVLGRGTLLTAHRGNEESYRRLPSQRKTNFHIYHLLAQKTNSCPDVNEKGERRGTREGVQHD